MMPGLWKVMQVQRIQVLSSYLLCLAEVPGGNMEEGYYTKLY